MDIFVLGYAWQCFKNDNKKVPQYFKYFVWFCHLQHHNEGHMYVACYWYSLCQSSLSSEILSTEVNQVNFTYIIRRGKTSYEYPFEILMYLSYSVTITGINDWQSAI